MIQPKLIPTLFTIPALIVLLILGTWQVHRLQAKLSLIETIDERVAGAPSPLPELVDLHEDDEYRRFTVSGWFLHHNEVHLFTGARAIRGKPGYNIITPMMLTNGDVILVDRGWVPYALKEQTDRPKTLLPFVQDLEVMFHASERQGRMTPDNDLAKNVWFWIDRDAIVQESQLPIPDFYVRVIEKNETGQVLPIPGKTTISLRNDHLQYAITWYILAIVLMVIYGFYHKKNDGQTTKRQRNSQKLRTKRA